MKVISVEGLGVVDQGANIRGRDGGYSGVHDDRSVWLFGDSVTENANADGQNWFSSTWSTSIDIEEATHPTLMSFPTNLQPGNAALVEDDYLYAFGCDRNRNDVVCRLGRVSLEQALDVEQWEYATDSVGWSKDSSEASAMFFGADIMSVTFNTYLARYIVVYSEPTSRIIKLRSASSLAGPWSAPTYILTAMASDNTNGWVFDGLTHPQYNEQDGKVIYLTYTRDPGTEWFAREMRLVRVSLDLL